MYGKIRKQRTETGYFLTKVFLKGWSDTTKACIGSIFGCNVSPVSRSRCAIRLRQINNGSSNGGFHWRLSASSVEIGGRQ